MDEQNLSLNKGEASVPPACSSCKDPTLFNMGLRTAFAAALLLRSAADAARVCGSDAATPASFQWRVGDVRWDSADPQAGKQFATMAASIVPGLRGSFFECVAEWPQSWAGWYEGGSNIIWSDCIWSGAGPTYDRTVSFAVDWTNRTMYLSHTFACSNQQGLALLDSGDDAPKGRGGGRR